MDANELNKEKFFSLSPNLAAILILSSLALFFIGGIFLMRIPIKTKKEEIFPTPQPFSPPGKSKNPIFLFLPESQTLKKGSLGTIQMGLDTGLTKISQIEIRVEFNPDNLVIQKILPASAFPQVLAKNINNSAGYALISLQAPQPNQGKIIPGAIFFKVLSKASTDSPTTFNFKIKAKAISSKGRSFTYYGTEKALVNITH